LRIYYYSQAGTPVSNISTPAFHSDIIDLDMIMKHVGFEPTSDYP